MVNYRAILTALPLWCGQPVQITKLVGGGTNTNFVIATHGQRFVARFQGPVQRKFMRLNRPQEIANTRVAHRLGIGPRVVAHYPKYNLLVVQFIGGTPLRKKALREPRNLRAAASILKKLHHSSSFHGHFAVLESIRYFWKLAKRDGKMLPGMRQADRVKFSRCAAVVRGRRYVPRSCHVDLMPLNFIGRRGSLKLIDWEYSALGDPLFDLAFLSAVGRFRPQDDAKFLYLYFGSVTTLLRQQFKAIKALVYLREALWGLTLLGRSPLPFNYQAYIRKNIRWFSTVPVPIVPKR